MNNQSQPAGKADLDYHERHPFGRFAPRCALCVFSVSVLLSVFGWDGTKVEDMSDLLPGLQLMTGPTGKIFDINPPGVAPICATAPNGPQFGRPKTEALEAITSAMALKFFSGLCRLRVKLRRDAGHHVKPNADQLDGKVFNFVYGWYVEKEDSELYAGENVWLPADADYPRDAPVWIASGDLTDEI